MTWDDLDWTTLERLRSRFLAEAVTTDAYWTSQSELAGYDFTYGERIGWKWDAVIEEVRMRGWIPPHGIMLDWACGSGTAGRRMLRAFGPDRFDTLLVWDHSPLACDFAESAARAAFPSTSVASATPGFLASDETIGLLVVSHVINELDADGFAALRSLARRSAAVVWVEAGTRKSSRLLGGFREEWTEAHSKPGDGPSEAGFRIVAPCTHSHPCPILAPGNERHWCHHFAAPPPEIFMDPGWVRFGRKAGIDLRSLPYSFIALDRAWPPDKAAGMSRVIGRPESFKPYVRLLNCDAGGLTELEIHKRDNPALYKEIGRAKGPLLYRWRREGNRVTGVE